MPTGGRVSPSKVRHVTHPKHDLCSPKEATMFDGRCFALVSHAQTIVMARISKHLPRYGRLNVDFTVTRREDLET